MPNQYEVIIVGGGPVGMGLATELGQRGVRCAVLERHHEVGRIPKGQNLTNRTLEHFYFWHCVEELRSARLLPPGYPIGGVTAYGNLLSDYWYIPPAQNPPRGRPYFFQANERLPQYLTEEVLRARVVDLPTVDCLFDRTVKRVDQDGDKVLVTAQSEIWPYEDETYEAEYVVGCDGARSLVREQMGITRSGTNFDQKMVLAVFSAPALHDQMERFPERTTYHVINPDLEGKWQFFGRVEVGKSFFFHAPVPRETTTDDRELVQSVMNQAAGFEFEAEFEHLGFWELRIEVADTYRSGRVFIAGDACHSHPPYGGFGLNSGLEDVTNLGWKLAAVLGKWGGDPLLDSYSAERQPVFKHTGEDVIAGGILREKEWLSRHDLRRDPEDFKNAWEERAAGRSDEYRSYEVHYEGSPVVSGSAGTEPGIEGPPSYVARPGRHLAPATLSNQHNVFEELGTGFSLLAFGAEHEAVDALRQAAANASVPLKVIEDSYADERASYEASLILVRPDQFVAWAGTAAPSDPDALVATVAGLDG